MGGVGIGENKCTNGFSACVSTALAKCNSTATCHSVSVNNGGSEFEMFTLNNWSTTANSDWNSYVESSV